MKTPANILILSCGTRNLLMRYFKDKANGFSKVVGTDCSIYASALYEADAHYIVPPIIDPCYLDTVLDICRRESVTAVLPLLEDEIHLIAANRQLFTAAGITPVVSSEDAVEICRDKYAFYKYLQQNSLPAITSCDSFKAFLTESELGSMKLPVFLKPARGCGSIGAQKVEHEDLLKALCKHHSEPYIIQNFAEGEEFGADLYVDLLTKKLVSVFVKKKLRMRAGETEKSVSFKDGNLFDLIEQTIAPLHLLGPIDMDIFKIDGQYYISEINPRFGGGYPHAYTCGINFPQMIARNLSGQKVEPKIGDYEEGICMLKYTDLITLPFNPSSPNKAECPT